MLLGNFPELAADHDRLRGGPDWHADGERNTAANEQNYMALATAGAVYSIICLARLLHRRTAHILLIAVMAAGAFTSAHAREEMLWFEDGRAIDQVDDVLGARRIVAAVPVASADALIALRSEAEEVVCALAPEVFRSVGEWYEAFEQISDTEVAATLWRAHARARLQSTPRTSTEPLRGR